MNKSAYVNMIHAWSVIKHKCLIMLVSLIAFYLAIRILVLYNFYGCDDIIFEEN